MRVISFLLAIVFIGLLNISSTKTDGPKPKKVYRDTIYRWKTKPSPVSKPVVVTKPVESNKPGPKIAEKPVVKAPIVDETERKISITSTILRFRVKKSERKLYAFFADTFKVFKISLGANPIGHKIKQGDNKTPEGTYKISFKNPKSRGYKSLMISYPNDEDRKNAARQGVNPGGDICIHGLWWPQQDPETHWKDNWTRGCIALNNQQIEEIFNHTELETEITILP